jgi:hypothetical protein
VGLGAATCCWSWDPLCSLDVTCSGFDLRARRWFVSEGRGPATSKPSPSGIPEWTSWAAFNLGALLEDLGDTGAVTAAYQQAVEAGGSQEAALAAVNLGELLREAEYIEGAMHRVWPSLRRIGRQGGNGTICSAVCQTSIGELHERACTPR